MRFRLPALVLATLAAACTQTPTAVTPDGKQPAVADGANTVAALPDASPVATPRSLVLLVRAGSPKASVEAAEKLVPLPEKVFSLLEKETDGASKYIDFSESFDLAVGLDPSTRDLDDPKMMIAFSLPLAADYKPLLDMAEKEGQSVRQLGPGSYRIEGKGARDLSCEISTVAQRAPRLVCAEGQAAFREFSGYLARTLPVMPRPSEDVWMQAHFGPFREIILSELRRELDGGLAEARKEMERAGVRDSDLLDAPAIGARELVLLLEEVDRFEMGLRLDAQKPELSVSAELMFRGNQAWVTKVLTGQNGKRALPPEPFWRLPKDADSAFFGHTADPALFTGVRRTAKKGLAQGLDIAGQFAGGLLTDPDKQAIVALLESIPVTSGVWSSASGGLEPLPGGIPAASATKTITPAQAAAEGRNRARGFIGWNVVSTEGDIRQMHSFMKNVNDVYARGVGMIKKEADEKLRRASPDMKAFYKERREDLNRAPRVKFVSDPAGYPKGSAELSLDFDLQSDDVWSWVHPDKSWDSRPEHPKGRPAKSTFSARFAVVPDEANRYVWGYAADATALKDRLLSIRVGASKDKTLASRTDLERLKVPATQGGFINYGRILANMADLEDRDADMREMKAVLKQLPNRGAAPVFFVGGGRAGGAPSLQASLTMDKRWVDDLSALFKTLLKGGGAGYLKVPTPAAEESKAVPRK